MEKGKGKLWKRVFHAASVFVEREMPRLFLPKCLSLSYTQPFTIIINIFSTTNMNFNSDTRATVFSYCEVDILFLPVSQVAVWLARLPEPRLTVCMLRSKCVCTLCSRCFGPSAVSWLARQTKYLWTSHNNRIAIHSAPVRASYSG